MKTLRDSTIPAAVRARLDAELPTFPRRAGHVIVLPHGRPGGEVSRDEFERAVRAARLNEIDGPNGLLALVDEAIAATGCAAVVTLPDTGRAIVPVVAASVGPTRKLTSSQLAKLNERIGKRVLGAVTDLPDGTAILVTILRTGQTTQIRTAEITGEDLAALLDVGEQPGSN